MSILTLGFIRSRFNIMKDRNLKVRSEKAPICLFFFFKKSSYMHKLHNDVYITDRVYIH